MTVVIAPLARSIRRHKFRYAAVACGLAAVSAGAGLALAQGNSTVADNGPVVGQSRALASGGNPVAATRVCGKSILDSPYNYDGAPGAYHSGTAGLPTYGKVGSDFPKATAGVIIPDGQAVYYSYQLRPDTVYYLLPGTHVGSFMADQNDAFVGGLSRGVSTVLTGNYSGMNWGIDSNSSDGNQAGVTIEYVTIEKYQPVTNAGAINQDSNSGWTVQYSTITLNVPGAGVILGANNVLKDNCITLNGQYGFQSEDTNSWGLDSLTGGPYNVTVEGNEISYNDTCDFEGLLSNPAVGWSNHNPVPLQYRNRHCGTVVPDGDQGGFKIWQTDGVTIRDNYIHDNWGPGGWADTDNANTTYTGNTITDNDGDAIIEEISYNFAITNNYMADNAWPGGLNNPGFPTPAIYISGSGSDTAFGGVPACPEASCVDQRSYTTQSLISGNTLVDNGGNIFLWQDANRYCSDGYDGICTLVDRGAAGPFTIMRCKSNIPSASISTITGRGMLTGSPREDWWDGCIWKTENVGITHNSIIFNPARVTDCNKTDWPECGAGGIFSEYGSTSPYVSSSIATQLTFYQGDFWADNIYKGPSTFYVWNQGNGDNPVSWADWTKSTAGGDKCSSPGERQSGYCTGPFGQDVGSTYHPVPAA